MVTQIYKMKPFGYKFLKKLFYRLIAPPLVPGEAGRGKTGVLTNYCHLFKFTSPDI